LIIVYDVEVAPALAEHASNPPGKGERFAETGAEHDRELDHVLERSDLPRMRKPEGVRLAVQVEAGNRSETNAVVELGPWLAREDLD